MIESRSPRSLETHEGRSPVSFSAKKESDHPCCLCVVWSRTLCRFCFESSLLRVTVKFSCLWQGPRHSLSFFFCFSALCLVRLHTFTTISPRTLTKLIHPRIICIVWSRDVQRTTTICERFQWTGGDWNNSSPPDVVFCDGTSYCSLVKILERRSEEVRAMNIARLLHHDLVMNTISLWCSRSALAKKSWFTFWHF